MLSVHLSTVSFDFSGEFVGYSIVFAVVVLYYLLLSNYVRAFLVVQSVRLLDRVFQWGLGSEQQIDISSLAFAFLSGTVFINGLTFRTKNVSVQVLQATIRFNWFYVDVREGERRMDEALPCRLSIELVGVEVVVHHNSATYDHLAQLILNHPAVRDKAAAAGLHAADVDAAARSASRHRRAQRRPAAGAALSADVDAEEDERRGERALVEEILMEAKKREQSMPAFYRWFPVTKVTVKTCAVMVGNLKLPHFLVLHFVSAHAIHAINPPSSPHCYYQLTTHVQRLFTLSAFLAPNPEYTLSSDIVAIKRTLDAEDYFAVAIGAFGRFLSELDSELAQMQERGGEVGDTRFIRSYRKGQARARSVGPLSQWSYLVQSDKGKKQQKQHDAQRREERKERERADAPSGDPAAAVSTAAHARSSADNDAERIRLERERQAELEKKRALQKEVVLECTELSIEYVYDITTLLTAYDVAQLRLHPGKAQSEAPLTRMKVVLSSASMRYGPSLDNQRVLFLSYFKPFDYQNQVVYVPRVGQYRAYAAFDLELLVDGADGKLRVPYREASKMQREAERNSALSTGWLDVAFQADSSLSYHMELLPTKAGTRAALQLTLNQATLTPSFTKRPFIEAEQLLVSADLHWPQQWSAVHEWKYAITFHSPRVFFLSAHLSMVTDLLSDWSSFSEYQQAHRSIGGEGLEYASAPHALPPDLHRLLPTASGWALTVSSMLLCCVCCRYFQPYTQTYAVTILDFDLLCAVNANNMIDHVNSLDDNAFIAFRGPDCQVQVRTANKDWKARASLLQYDLHLRNVHAHLHLPTLHPLADLLESSNDLQLAYATTIGVTASMLTHHKYNTDYRDSHTVLMTLEGVEVEVTGHYLRYVLHFYDNYIGSCSTHLSTADFVLSGYRNLLAHSQAMKAWEARVHNAYETMLTVVVENLTLNLADHLFTSSPSHQPKVRCYELQVQLRSLQQYTDIFLSFTPLTLTVPIPVALAVRLDDGVQRGWNDKETSVQVLGLRLSYHSSKGDPPRSIVYRSSLKVMVEELNAQLLPSQLALLLQSLTAIRQQWADAVDHSKPAASTSTLMPTIDSNNDTLELITAKKQLTSFLQDQMNTALADNGLEVAVGQLRFNLLHPPAQALGHRSPDAHLSVTRLLLSQGAQLTSSTLITPQAHSKLAIEVPSIDLAHLIANSAADVLYSPLGIPQTERTASSISSVSSASVSSSLPWLSVADFHCGLTLSVSDQRVDCVAVMRKQQDLIYSQMHQEAAADDNDGFSWHETNATKVPYLYNDDWQQAGPNAHFAATHSAMDAFSLSPTGHGPRGDQEEDGVDVHHTHAVHTPRASSPLYEPISPEMSPASPLPRGLSYATKDQRMGGDWGPGPAALPPSKPSDRLRSHAQKRSVQIARSGLQLPRAAGLSSNRIATSQRLQVPTAAPRASFTALQRRRPSLLQSITVTSLPPTHSPFKPRRSRTPPLVQEGYDDEERKVQEEEDQEDDEENVVVTRPPFRVRLQRGESWDEGDVSPSSFESCQSLSELRPELSERLSDEARDGQDGDTWEECREEGQPPPPSEYSDVDDDERRGEAEERWSLPSSSSPQPSPHPSQVSTASDGPLIPPLPRLSSHVSTVPSAELQQYLEHFSLHPHSHSFLLPLHLRQRRGGGHHSSSHAADSFNAFASASNVLSPSSSPHASISLDSDLAGTAAGAFLVLPIVSFYPREYPDHASRTPSPALSPMLYDHSSQPRHAFHATYDDAAHANRPRPSSLDQLHRDARSGAARAQAAGAGLDSVYRDELDEQENATFTSTRHVVVEATQDVSVTITPAFIAALDHYLPLLQPTHSTIEDTLDELHLQFTRAFTSKEEDELQMALAREQPFTTCSHFTVNLPSVSIEFLQSALTPSPAPLSASSLVYSTILCVDSLRLQRTVDHPLPAGFGSASTSSAFPSLIDLATPVTMEAPILPTQPPATELTVNFSRLHLFSALLNPGLHLAAEPGSAQYPPPMPSAPPSLRSVIAIPPSLLSSLPAELLSTCLVFFSFEVGSTRLHYAHSVDVVLHPSPALEAHPHSHRASTLFTFDAASSPVPQSEPMPARRLSVTTASGNSTPAAVFEYSEPTTMIHRDDFAAKRGSAGFMELSHPDASYPYTGAPPAAHLSDEEHKLGAPSRLVKTWSLTSLFTPVTGPRLDVSHEGEVEMTRLDGGQPGKHRRVHSNVLRVVDESEGDDADEKGQEEHSRSATSENRQVESEVRDRFVALPPPSSEGSGAANTAAASPSPSAPQSPASVRSPADIPLFRDDSDGPEPVQYHHNRHVHVELHISSVQLSAGSDAPQRLLTLLLDWWQSAQQVDIAKAFDDQAQVDRDDALHPVHPDESGRTMANLLPLIPGGPASSARRYRWQSVLSFALQHLQHSRVLEGTRSATSAFTEDDQIHLLQWYHHKAMRSYHEARHISRMQAITEEQSRVLQAQEHDLVNALNQYRISESSFLPPSLQSTNFQRTVIVPRLPPSALAPHLHAIMQQSTVNSPDVNYVLSTAAPLTVAMRKLLKLPVSLMRRLNFKLQRMDNNPLASSSVPLPPPLFSATTGAAHGIDPQLDLHQDYTKLFSAEKLRTTPLALLSLNTFARLAPQAAKVQSMYGPGHLSPALWRIAGENIDVDGMGSKLDANHRVALDEDEQTAEVRVHALVVRVVNGEERSERTSEDEGQPEADRWDHTITLNEWTMHVLSSTTPRLLADHTDVKAVPVPGVPAAFSATQSNLTTPLPTPLATPQRGTGTHTRPSLAVPSLDAHTRPPLLQSLSVPLSPPVASAEVASAPQLPLSATPPVLRLNEVVLLTDCRTVWVELSPSLHLFLDSALRQAEAMEPWLRSVKAPSHAGSEDAANPLSSAPHTAGAAEQGGAAGGFRPRSVSDPAVQSLPSASPRPVTALAPTYGSRRSPVPLSPLVTNVHVQAALKTFGFRVRMPQTGSIVLSTSALTLAASRYIPALLIDPSSRKDSKENSKPRMNRGRSRRPRTAAGAGPEHRTGSLRKAQEERKAAAAERDGEKDTDVAGLASEFPVTSVLLRVEGLDSRLLDAESCDVPLAELVSADDGKGGARKSKESVLTSLVARKCTVGASYTSDVSPLAWSGSSLAWTGSALAAVPLSSRGSVQRPATGHRHMRRSIFSARPPTAPAPRPTPRRCLAVLIRCEESVLTLPFYELESLYFSDYLGPWRPTIQMLTAAPTVTVSAAVGDSAIAAPRLPTRVTCQLVSVSLAMLPLPTVMITYHVDRLWVKANRSREDEVQFMLSLGAHNRATDAADSSGDDSKDAHSAAADAARDLAAAAAVSFRPGESSILPINSHKITLHSANARKRKPRREEHAESGAVTGHHTRRPTAFAHSAAPASMSSMSASSYGGLGAVLYSRMQFVMDFALPTLRTSMSVRKDAEQGGWRVDDSVEHKADGKSDPQLDPAVAAALMRLSSEQAEEDDDDRDDDDSSSDYSSEDDSTRDHSGVKDDVAFTAAHAARIRLVDGVIGVGAMSNQLNENVLNRLLHLQSTLNTELNQLIEKFAHYSQTTAAPSEVPAKADGARAKADPTVDDGRMSGAWERFCFNVSVVFDDVHLTAGLDANKKTHRNRRSVSHPYASGAFASTLEPALSPSGAAVYFDSSWDPVVEVRTGTVSLAVRYTPRLYRAYKQRRQELQQRHAGHARRSSQQWSESLSAEPDVDPLSRLSDVVIEFNCYGAGIELSTSGRERYDAYTLLMSQAPRRSLVQLASHIQLRLGLDSENAHVNVELSLRSPLMKVTAIPPLIGSVHALTDRYASAYDHYQAEAAKLNAEEDFRDPILGLRQLQTTGVWASLHHKGDHDLVSATPVSPAASDAGAAMGKPPHVVADINAGSLARVLSLLDALNDRTHHHLRLLMDSSEVVILFERPPAPTEAAFPQTQTHAHGHRKHEREVGGSWSDLPEAPHRSSTMSSVPPSPSLSGAGFSSLAATPLSHASEGSPNGFFPPTWQLDGAASSSSMPGVPVTAAMSAIVLSLDHFLLRTHYLPAAAAAAAGALSASSSLLSSSASPTSSVLSAYPAYRPVYGRQPTNQLHAEMSGEGLELGFLTGLPETNNLQHLAATLLHFRQAVTPPPPPSSIPATPSAASRSSSTTNTPVMQGMEGRSRLPAYVYNRLLVRSSSLTLQSSLPVVSATTVSARSAGGPSSALDGAKGGGLSKPPAARGASQAAHLRNVSIASSVASASSHLSSASTGSAVVNRDITVQVHASSSGCEIDVDPSLIHHFHDASALLDLLSSVSQEALDEHWTHPPAVQSPPPSRPGTAAVRGHAGASISPLSVRAGDGGRSARGGQSVSPDVRRRRHLSSRRRHRSAEGRRRRLRRAADREWSDADSPDHDSDGPEGREVRRRYRARRAEQSARVHRRSRSTVHAGSADSPDSGSSSPSSSTDSREFVSPPTSPPPERSQSPTDSALFPSVDVVTKTDIIVEIELNFAQGRLALHPNPVHVHHKRRMARPVHHRHVSVDSGMHEWTGNARIRSPRLRGATTGGSGDFVLGEARNEEAAPAVVEPASAGGLYGFVHLPSIACTYLAQHDQRTEHVLMVEITQPALRFSPSILHFVEAVEAEAKKAAANRTHAHGADAFPTESGQASHERFASNASNLSRASAAATAAPTSSLFAFLTDCSAASRTFTVTLRVRPTSVSFDCRPGDDAVYLKVGTNRPFDVAICSSTALLPSSKTENAPASTPLPSIAVTAHLASMFVELGAATDVASSHFLSLRVHHARLHFTQAYGLHAMDASLPSRAAVFSVDHVQQSKLTVSACSSLLIWMRAWALDRFDHGAVPSADAASSPASLASSQPTTAPSLEALPMTYLLLAVGKVKFEVNMLDIEGVNNRTLLSLSHVACRMVNLGGSPTEPKPFLLSAGVKELAIESHPDLDGLEGTLLCNRGFRVRLLRLPLAVAALEDEEDDDGDVEQNASMEAREGHRRRRRRSFAEDDSDESDGHARLPYDDDDAAALSSAGSAQRKRMVNKLECVVQPIHIRFTVLGGRVELIRGYTSAVAISIQDQFYPTAPLDLFEKRGSRAGGGRRTSRWSGRWVTQSDIDMGERLVIGASSTAIPYFIDLLTLVIKHLQAEISKYPVQPPPSLPPSRPNTADASRASPSLALSAAAAAGMDAMIDDGSGNLRLTGRSIRVELNSEDERDRAVASLVEYSLSLTKECETKPIDEGRDDYEALYQQLTPAAILRGEQETLRVLLLDVGKHRLDEEDGRYEYVPIRMARPYSEGLFISRLSPPTDDREIVRVPGFVLEMETLEYEYQQVVRSRFLTFWDRAMTVTVDVRHYKFLQAMVDSFAGNYTTAVDNVHRSARTMRDTAKRAATDEQRQRQQQRGQGGGRSARMGAPGKVDHLQPPGPSSHAEALSSRVKFQLAQPKAALEEADTSRARSASAQPAPTSSRGTIKALFQRRPDSPIQLYIKGSDDSKEERKEAAHPSGPPSPPPSASASPAPIPSVAVLEPRTAEEKQKDPIADSADALKGHGGASLAGGQTEGAEGAEGAEAAVSPVGGAKRIDELGVVEFNPQIHVLDNTSSGVSSRKILELLGMKGDLSIIPQSTHQLTMVMDQLMEACRSLSRGIDSALD